MAELTQAEIDALLAKGLGRAPSTEGQPSPLAGAYNPLVVNIPGPRAVGAAPSEPATPAQGPVPATNASSQVSLPDITTLTGAARQPVPGPGAGIVGSGYTGPSPGTLAATPAQLASAFKAAQQAVVPPMVRDASTGPKPSEGTADFDVIMQALWQTESGNRQHDANGKTIISPKGAIGVSQLMPATAKGLGVDPYNEDQNRAGGKKELSRLYEKYGNYRDALGAYFAGDTGYDRWVASGSKRDSKIGQQITKYQDTVLANAGILERGAVAQKAPDGSTLLTGADARALMYDVPPQTPEEIERRSKRDDGILASIMDASKATTYSLYKGARDVELGVLQAALEQVAPESAKALTARVNEVDRDWKPLLDRHSVLSTVGEVTGSVGAILGGAGLLGTAVRAIPGASAGMEVVAKQIAPRVPWLLRESGALTIAGRYVASAPVGAAISAGTAFNKSGNPADRVSEAVLGAIAGPLGVAVGQGVAKAMSVASTRGELGRLMGDLKANADVLSKDLNELKTVGVDRVSRLEQEAGRRYAAATQSGKSARGLDAQTLDDTIKGYKTKAASEIEQTKNALRAEMGLDKEAAGAAQSAVQHQQYADQVRAVAAAQEAHLDKMMTTGGMAVTNPRGPENAALRATLRARMTGDPSFPQASMGPPAPYESGVISAEQYMKGRQFLERQKRQATTRAKRNQVAGLRAELDKSFAAAAKDAGMSASEFYRKLLMADRFYKSQVVPAHDVFSQGLRFGNRYRGSERIKDDAVNKLTAGLDPTKVYERVVQTVESGTNREVEALLHVFGSTPRDKEKLVRSLAHRALTKAQGGIGKEFDPSAVAKYIKKNHTNLSRVLTPEQYQWMRGFSRVVEAAGEAAKSAEKSGSKRFWRGSNFLLMFGMEHIIRGDFMHGASLITSGIVAHTLFHSVPALRATPVLNRLVRNAADLRPGSEELNRLAAQIEWQYVKRAGIAARYVGEKTTGGSDAPRFQPLSRPPAQTSAPPH